MKKYRFCLLLCFTYVSVVIMTATMADARTLKMYAPYVEESYITQGLSARELALSRLRKIGLESEVLDNGNANMETETSRT